ncbi:class C beta-lactamase-related serine hydrolase [Psychrobacillus glaciei]|uniref:Class C beta-lactamase-related serine hydrolase n=1 Tax=Psychrobacillus glaciei TaxID=2283160 RepID=A0A5J6SN96_9BACI|nr:serine hydrolase [Psychrobacillus glaciei]QFF99378.1 class C beta-lactamase-related serine hydrolase [Psychrobacillus glaciei]
MLLLIKITGIPTAVFAEENLFAPLGIKKYTWVKDPQGINGGGFSISMNMEDMMKIGLLLLKYGRYASKQVISSNWITKSQSPQQEVGNGEYGTFGYGYQFWTCNSSNTQNPIDYFYANGIYGQYIFVVPKLNIVAVAKSQLQKDNQSLPRLYFEEFLRSFEIPSNL